MKKMDSDALGTVNKSLGLTGSGAANTEFADGTVEQVLDVGPMVRRGRTPAATGGLFTCTFSFTSSGAQELQRAINPYEPGGALTYSPYPNSVNNYFDLWVLDASMNRQSGSGTIEAGLYYQFGNRGWGIDQSGARVDPLTVGSGVLAVWDDFQSVGSAEWGVQGDQVKILPKIPKVRLARTADTYLIFHINTSATCEVNCVLTLGMFPNGLGQDGAV